MQIDFSSAFDRVCPSGFLYNFRGVAVDGAVFDVYAGFLSRKMQRDMVDGVSSENVMVVFGGNHQWKECTVSIAVFAVH